MNRCRDELVLVLSAPLHSECNLNFRDARTLPTLAGSESERERDITVIESTSAHSALCIASLASVASVAAGAAIASVAIKTQ